MRSTATDSSSSPMTARCRRDQAVLTAGGRCDQENLVAQLKGGVHALTTPRGQPGQQLGVHGHGQPGLELEGVGRVAGARDARARPAAPDPEANAVARTGVQDVPVRQ